jgi:hypothetical protein
VDGPVGVVVTPVPEVVLEDVVVVAVLLEGPIDAELVELVELLNDVDEELKVEEVDAEIVELLDDEELEIEEVDAEIVELLDDEELEVNEVDEEVEELLGEDPGPPTAIKTLAWVT